MALRMVCLFAVAGVACVGAVASAAHGTRAAAASARIPALPARSESSPGRCPIPARFRPAFERAAHDAGLQLSMLVAVAQVESEFKPGARSSADAHGLLQVMPTTAAELKLDVDKPSSNVLAGARYLKLMLNRFPRTDLALAAYNAGPTIVTKLGRAPTPRRARIWLRHVICGEFFGEDQLGRPPLGLRKRLVHDAFDHPFAVDSTISGTASRHFAPAIA